MRATVALAAILLLAGGAAQARQPASAGGTTPWGLAAPLLLAQEDQAGPTGTPELRPARIAGQVAAGFGSELIGFFVGAPIGAGIGAGIAQITPLSTRQGLVAGAFAGSVAGLTAGAAAGVYFTGRRGDQTASFGATIGGAAAGTVIALSIVQKSDTRLGAALNRFKPMLALPPLGAALGFLATRAYR